MYEMVFLCRKNFLAWKISRYEKFLATEDFL